MKRIIFVAFAVFLLLSLTACGISTPQDETTAPTKGNENIVPDPNDVKQYERYNDNGEHVGYMRFTYGTNDGVYGMILMEFLDLDGNVLNAYSPKLPGHQLSEDGNMFQEYDSNWSWGDPPTTNRYLTHRNSDGELAAYIEVRQGQTTKCELYDREGNVIASLQPLDPKNELHVLISPSDEKYQSPEYFEIQEFYPVGEYFCDARRVYYKTNGEFIGDLRYTYDNDQDALNFNPARVEIVDQNGKVVRTFNRTKENSGPSASYSSESNLIFVGEGRREDGAFWSEYLSAGTYKTVFKIRVVYENGAYSHTEIERNGGKIELTNDSIEGAFTKMEIYDAQGNLIKTVEPPEGGFLTIGWRENKGTCDILVGVYDAQSERVGSETH